MTKAELALFRSLEAAIAELRECAEQADRAWEAECERADRAEQRVEAAEARADQAEQRAAQAEGVRPDTLRDRLDVLQADLDRARRDAQAMRRGEEGKAGRDAVRETDYKELLHAIPFARPMWADCSF